MDFWADELLEDLAMLMPCLEFVTCRIAGGSVAIDVFDLLQSDGLAQS